MFKIFHPGLVAPVHSRVPAEKLLTSFFTGFMALVWSGSALAQSAYISNSFSNDVSVINITTNAVVATVAVGTGPYGVAVSPDGSRAYVANNGSSSVSVINTTTNAIVATVGVGAGPYGVAVSPDGSRAYVGKPFSNNVSVINTANNAVTTVPVGSNPISLGNFIGPAPTAAPVPTLSQWALFMLGLILAGGAAHAIHRRRVLA